MQKIYTDGGLIGPGNPSGIGGTWAFRLIEGGEKEFTVINQESGIILPQQVHMAGIESNLSEFIAMLFALRSLPDGWEGDIYCDSKNTLYRFFGEPQSDGSRKYFATNGILPTLVEDMRHQVGRMKNYNYTLLDGHPTRMQLNTGFGKRNHPVSRHNVWCDEACKEQAIRKLRERRKAEFI